MTDRFKGCVVTFGHDIREDDAEAVLDAIAMIKGVADVNPSLSSADDLMNRNRIRREYRERFYKLEKELFDD